jgi:multicomponent Na+:H+ antiporter subunit G
MIEILTSVSWVAGSTFALLAALGVLRMPDVFTRMQASTKASTLGLGCLLVGAGLAFGDFTSFIRVASIGAFVLLTTPVAAHVIARASYLADVPLWAGTALDERRTGNAGAPPPQDAAGGRGAAAGVSVDVTRASSTAARNEDT